ncbi:MAG TPA: tetratricopeptide repeat protein [Tepidisphaeraceae bacterium]|nr:tetratricopeptide repeat protein [Tepidisphaeraceae bacterium]
MWNHRAIGIVIAALVLAAFARIGRHEFAGFDDAATIYHNPHLNPPTLRGILYYWTTPELGLYIPATYTVWGTLAQVGYLDEPDDKGIHLNPWVFHTASILFHVASTLVVFAILRHILQTLWPAAIGALIFGLHPLQVETVAWASGMKDLLAGFLSLLALWQYLRFLDPAESRTQTSHYALATFCLTLAMLAKPIAMVVPFMAAALAHWVAGRSWRQVATTLWPWAILSFACAILTRVIQPAIGVPTTPAWTRPLIAADALAFYLYKLICPLSLAVDYGRRPVAVMSSGWVAITWMMPAFVGLLLWIVRKRYPLLIVAGFIFVIGLVPVLGLVPFEFQGYSTVSDHYLYLPMLGIALAAAWATGRIHTRAGIAACCVVVMALGIRSFLQAKHWATDEELWAHTLEVNPDSWVANVRVGTRLASIGKAHEGADRFRHALQVHPDYGPAHRNLAVYLASTGKFEEAISHVQTMIDIANQSPGRRQSELASAYALWGTLLMDRGQYREAAEKLRRALQEKPDDAETVENLRIAEQQMTRSGPPSTRPTGEGVPNPH